MIDFQASEDQPAELRHPLIVAKLVDGVLSYFITCMLTPKASDSPPPPHPLLPLHSKTCSTIRIDI